MSGEEVGVVSPQDLDAEEAVLGALISAGALGLERAQSVLADIDASGLASCHFWRPSHGVIFTAGRRLLERGEPSDAISLAAELERMGKLKDDAGKVRVHELAVLAPTTLNAAHHAALVVEKARRRDELRLSERLQSSALNGGLGADPRLVQELEEFVSAVKGLGPRGKNPSLPFAPLRAALAEASEEPRWVWRGYIAEGAVTLLAGRPKVGKSTLAFGLFAAIASGQTFLDVAVEREGILLLSEERKDSLAEKQRRFSLEDGVHLLMRHDASSAAWPDVVARAVAHCDEHDLGLLAVDTFDKWTGLRGDAENNAGDILGALEPLQLAAAHGLAVLVVVHQRKSAGEYGEAVRGSNALTGGVDVVLELERPAPSLAVGRTTRVLRAVSRFAATPEELVADLDDDGYQACGDLASAKAEADRSRLLATLEQIGEAKSEQLAEELGIADGTVRGHLAELREAGRVAREGKGRRGDPYRWRVSFRDGDPLKAAETNSEASAE